MFLFPGLSTEYLINNWCVLPGKTIDFIQLLRMLSIRFDRYGEVGAMGGILVVARFRHG